MKILRTTLNSIVVMLNRFVMVSIDHKRHFKQKTSTVLWGIGSSGRWCCHWPRANFRKWLQTTKITIFDDFHGFSWIFMKISKKIEMKILRTTLNSIVVMLNRFVMVSIDHKRHFKQKTSMVLWGIGSPRRWCCHHSRENFGNWPKSTQNDHIWWFSWFFMNFHEIIKIFRNDNP